MVGARSGVPALAPYASKRYPYPTLAINDQIRAEEFIREFGEREKAGTIPQLSILSLNSDHTNGTRPGSPTPRAMVADDDLALGRIVERISKSPVWKDSLILVTEDDAQNGVDHVDGHRTIALAIGPHVRRGVVDSNHYNHTGLIRTIQEIYRIPARTRALRGGAAHDQHLHRRCRHDALPAPGDQDPARRDESAAEGARRPAALGRATVAGHELQGYRRRPGGHPEPHPVVGRQGLEHALSEAEVGQRYAAA